MYAQHLVSKHLFYRHGGEEADNRYADPNLVPLSQGRSNIQYVDGHVSSKTYTEIDRGAGGVAPLSTGVLINVGRAAGI